MSGQINQKPNDIEMVLDDHENRLVKLEKSDLEKELRIQKIEDNYLRLENTIMAENRETRDILREGMNKQWELIKSRDDKFAAEAERQHILKKTRIERNSEILLRLLTAGGIIYLLMESLFTK